MTLYVETKYLTNRKIAIFGAGLDGQLAYDYLITNGINPICYFDNDKSKHNTLLKGLEVLNPEKLLDTKDLVVLIAVKSSMQLVKEQLDDLNIENYFFSNYITIKTLSERKDDYIEVYNLLEDDKSKDLYTDILMSRIAGDERILVDYYDKDAFYSLPQFHFLSNEIMVDAGAYTGDTLEKFIWNSTGRFNRIYAFEPGKRQFDAMKYRSERLIKEWSLNDDQIVCVNAGLGESDYSLEFTDNNDFLTSNFSGNKKAEPNAELSDLMKIYSLDSYLKGERITLLKSDTEGFELELLRGAKNTIKMHKPKLAISVYHRYDDLLNITLYIKSLVPEYKMAIRHHSTNMAETVLYCWI